MCARMCVCMHAVGSYVHTEDANAPTKNQKSFLEQCETVMNSCYSASLRHNMHVCVSERVRDLQFYRTLVV
jgi:hypothetical protein